MISLLEMLSVMVKERASDLHLAVGAPPQFRVDGTLVSFGKEKLTAETCCELVYSILSDEQKKKLEQTKELDTAFGIEDLSRFRVNVYYDRNCIACAIRTIPYHIFSFEELGLPNVVKAMARKPRGLVLVTGPTGCGKSTTLASIIDLINNERSCHIITIEDPVEYVHAHKKSIVNQREIGRDTFTFANGLKYVLRQDPDIIMIGEMRDLETISAALVIAETGHLVFATVHTNDTGQTINRIMDVFPPHQQPQVRTQLSFVIEGILSQQLVPKAGGKGRTLALEILVPNPAIRNLIREEKTHQIYSVLQTGQKIGMQTMNQSLLDLYVRGLINYNEAISHSFNQDELLQMIK